MLILILIDVQYSQKAVFSFEQGSNGQNHSSGSHHPVKKSPQEICAISTEKFCFDMFNFMWKVLEILFSQCKSPVMTLRLHPAGNLDDHYYYYYYFFKVYFTKPLHN